MKQDFKKVILSLSLILVFTVYVIQKYISGSDNENFVPQAPAILPAKTGSQPSVGSPESQPTAGSPRYKNGSYIGKSADAFYGNVQVKVTIRNNKITDVQFLDYPRDRQLSVLINGQAKPYLRSEAIQTQSADVDAVSGATATSNAFKESLSSALNQAGY